MNTRQAGVQITKQMISAGVQALRDADADAFAHRPSFALEVAAEEVFLAMSNARE